MGLSVIILAGGDGTRMKSSHPKVLHQLAGKSLLQHVYLAVNNLNIEQLIIICGSHMNSLQQHLADPRIIWVEQKQRLGTGHAVKQALDKLNNGNQVLILCADVPLIKPDTLSNLLKSTALNQLGILTVNLADPAGLGRIVRDKSDKVKAIVEHILIKEESYY